MGKITSNLFNINFNENIIENTEIINTFDESIDLGNIYKDYDYLIKEEVNKILNAEYTLEHINLNFIELTLDNFSNYQYKLLENKFIALKSDGEVYSFITPDGIVYKSAQAELINLIVNTPYPKKIVFKEVCVNVSFISLDLIAAILFNKYNISLSDLTKLFYKNDGNDDIFNLFYLLKLYPSIDKILKKYSYSSYLSSEHKVYNALKTSNLSFIFNELDVKNRLDISKSRIEELINTLGIEKYTYSSPAIFLEYICNNTSFYPTLNPKLLKFTSNEHLSNLYTLHLEVDYLNSILSNNYSNIINTYNKNGLITSQRPFIDISDKVIIKGSFSNLYFNILTEILNDPQYIIYINSNKNLISEVIASNNTEYSSVIEVCLEWCVKAYICGCSSIEDYGRYIYEEELTVLSEKNLNKACDIFNKELEHLISLIDKYNNSYSKAVNNKLITHNQSATPLHKAIMTKYRQITKSLIAEVSEYIEDYNKKNKSKLYIAGYYNDSIYVACDSSGFTVAVDTLTRTLVKVYDKYLHKTKAICTVENLSL